MVDLSFAQVEETLARVHNMDWQKRGAFTSRLKHMQKQGLPRRALPGRGKAGSYNFSQLTQMGIGLELIQIGFPPKLAADTVLGNWPEMRVTALLATYNTLELRTMDPPESIEPWFWMLTPEVMRELATSGVTDIDNYLSVQTVAASELSEKIVSYDRVGVVGESRRRVILNGTEVVREILKKAVYELECGTAEELRADIVDEIQREQTALNDAMGIFANGVGSAVEVERAIEMMDLRKVFPLTVEEKAQAAAIIARLDSDQRDIVAAMIASAPAMTIAQSKRLAQLGLIANGSTSHNPLLTPIGMSVASELRWMAEDEETPEMHNGDS
ncbi:hypothetical protein U1839_06205 [Sphingomonas sp. RT2P30]|uniref:hypothetical protein n=1 Tax=Parasphingomonas halimpatiens TaxID=3096162 RepID=UPI002FC9BCF6